MYRGPKLFWWLVGLLILASLGFAVGAESRRRRIQTSEFALETGALVELSRVSDGDTIVVRLPDNSTTTIRLLGIKSFSTIPDKDPASQFGKAAVAQLSRLLAERPIRVMLNNPAKDRYGRYLAELFVDQQDVGLELVRQGLVLVYAAYPFPSMSLFLHEQEFARSERRGLWASPEVAKRAELLIRQWSREPQ